MKESEIEILERQGCFSSDWSKVEIADGTDLSKIRNVYFSGPVKVGKDAVIINVPGGLSNVRIGDGARIVNVARIENTATPAFGLGIDVAVLDETGTRPVRIYPGISAQIAAIAARMPEYAREKLIPMTDRHISEIAGNLKDMPEIGANAEIRDCGPIIDVRVWPGVKIEGAARLKNGSIVNNAWRDGLSVKSQELSVKDEGVKVKEGIAYVGHGVDAENFIIEDGMVSGGSLIRDTYVGQGSVLDKGFTSHDSLFFANCSMENGEACAVLAGPYTVSMHKSSLLIGCQTAFMNAGSGTNMSNHMYKLGPVHWGVLERGVKTSSNSYLMHGSRIGAFSLVMGEHKTHPDTSEFPFSYLFGDKDGSTIVVPGAMLKSFGLKRDGEKWPKRDRRLGHGIKLNDRMTYSILNPYTTDMILRGIETIKSLKADQAEEDGFINYKGLKIKPTSLEKGLRLYQLALCKYIRSIDNKEISEPSKRGADSNEGWIDLLGYVISESGFNAALNAGSVEEMEAALDNSALGRGKDLRLELPLTEIEKGTLEFDAMVENDRTASVDQITRENDMLSLS
ncbi:MAG: DUF4954 family protein [Muribaculaceae bacterium]|nr:DUF4954 family protein [Muribaculaceae bacterium]